MILKKISAEQINLFFDVVAPRIVGKTPENYFPENQESLNSGNIITICAYSMLQQTREARAQGARVDDPTTLLLSGFLLGREFATWNKELESLESLVGGE